MDKKKVADLAKSCSLSCKKLVKDKQLMRTLTSPAVMLVSLTVINWSRSLQTNAAGLLLTKRRCGSLSLTGCS